MRSTHAACALLQKRYLEPSRVKEARHDVLVVDLRALGHGCVSRGALTPGWESCDLQSLNLQHDVADAARAHTEARLPGHVVRVRHCSTGSGKQSRVPSCCDPEVPPHAYHSSQPCPALT